MRRRLFNLLAAGSMIVLIVVIALWVRSFASETILLKSRHGQILVIGIDCSPKAVRQAVDNAGTIDTFLRNLRLPVSIIVGATGKPPPAPIEQHALGFLLVRGEWCQIPDPDAANNFWTPPFWIAGIPYWFISLLAAAAPAAWLWRRSRMKLRRSHGRCTACGYDLRATPNRCPECGAVAEPAASIAQSEKSPAC